MPHGALYEFAQLYYDIVSAVNPVSFDAIRKVTSMSHLLYGSDFPFWHPDVTSVSLEELKLSSLELRGIERDNAIALLPNLTKKYAAD